MDTPLGFLMDESVTRKFVLRWSLLVLSAMPLSGHSAIVFDNVTTSAGFNYQGRSWGSAWTDFNKDGYPDLWVGNHISPPQMFINLRNGTFLDVAAQLLPELQLLDDIHDAHGSAWADFDNDGDQDLFQVIGSDLVTLGGSSPNWFFVNEGGALVERAAELNLGYSGGRGRMPLWLDANNDGWLDLYDPTDHPDLGADPSALFQGSPSSVFQEVSVAAGIEHTSTRGRNYALLGDMDGDGKAEMLLEENMRFPFQVAGIGVYPFTNIDLPGNFAIHSNEIVIDALIADLDGDLDNDMLFVKGEIRDDVVISENNALEGSFGGKAQVERGINFLTNGDVEIDLRNIAKNWPLSAINIGTGRLHPSKPLFTLSATDVNNQGIATHVGGVDRGIFIGFDPAQGHWVFLVSHPAMEIVDAFIINSTQVITSFNAIGWNPNAAPPPDRYFVNNGSVFDESANLYGLGDSAGRSVVAGDFDNDMDLDLYTVSSSPVQNIPNVLYENIGNGQFVRVAAAGGAGGTIKGRGDAVSMADYDLDGYLDLFVTNGKSRRPFEEDGPVEMFHNRGSGNHWIQIDLEGVLSNRDGIGANVMLTSNGVVQRRDQAAGIHSRAQNHMRIHAGLGANTRVNQIEIKWPSGTVQSLRGIPADQVLHIMESMNPSVLGKPQYTFAQDTGVYLWRDQVNGPYKLRVNADASKRRTFTVKVISSEPMTNVTPVSLEGQDQWQQDSHGFQMQAIVMGGQDGVDFTLAPGATALISVEEGGVANPRQLHVGATGSPLTPAGWIRSQAEFPTRPGINVGTDLGLFIGKNTRGNRLEARLAGNGTWRESVLNIMGSTRLSSASLVNMETSDKVVQTANSISVISSLGPNWDGLAFGFVSDINGSQANVGFAYVQDGMNNVRSVNHNDHLFGEPNAYWLPLN